MPDTPTYMADVLAQIQARGGPQPGKVFVVSMAHADDCSHFDGESCTCVPDVTFAEQSEGRE